MGCLNYHYSTIGNSIGLKTSRELFCLINSWIVRFNYVLYLDWMIQMSAIELEFDLFF